ncbi:hypothetical protein A2617_04160 [Candidatus Daviesbacteria bacterium RIFOXYD1_FULL_41_10]|uniref:Uncharacterized protein n=1 Tax=Candidatus Daviesbacteria bacterium RIFOXYD1_FULL_41_10 TaxID=1797801 RepID=A0A1F5N0A4_9BACT|nr:MAG: hypothetical protein A2617_04160 [Candidatus Daviesbacteria bacterium RIFOXYD1_FULL_41_10]
MPIALRSIVRQKTTIILTGMVLLLALGGFFVYQRFMISDISEVAVDEIDLSFDPEGPFAILTPRRDGNALILNLKRTASYDKISYELAYNSEGIDRGVMGEINAEEKKGEYEQEILFGTCSKNVCKYDKDVENGTLILHIRKGSEAFRMITQWRLQKPDVVLGKLVSGDGHFAYNINPQDSSLTKIGFSIINDLTGAPKLLPGKAVFGKVYTVNVPLAKNLPGGEITLELSEAPSESGKLFRFDDGKNEWVALETSASGDKVSGKSESGGIFAVLIDQQ